jgi:hypothetical protein
MKIVDLDNCISEDRWRVETIDYAIVDTMKRFHRYHSLAPWDRCVPGDVLDGPEPIIIFTARPVLYRDMTLEWLRRNGVQPLHLLMRNNDDHRPSLDLKFAQLGWLRHLYDVPLEAISVAYDDRPEIVDMYRRCGLNGQIRAIHPDIPYTPYNAHAQRS